MWNLPQFGCFCLGSEKVNNMEEAQHGQTGLCRSAPESTAEVQAEGRPLGLEKYLVGLNLGCPWDHPELEAFLVPGLSPRDSYFTGLSHRRTSSHWHVRSSECVPWVSSTCIAWGQGTRQSLRPTPARLHLSADFSKCSKCKTRHRGFIARNMAATGQFPFWVSGKGSALGWAVLCLLHWTVSAVWAAACSVYRYSHTCVASAGSSPSDLSCSRSPWWAASFLLRSWWPPCSLVPTRVAAGLHTHPRNGSCVFALKRSSYLPCFQLFGRASLYFLYTFQIVFNIVKPISLV